VNWRPPITARPEPVERRALRSWFDKLTMSGLTIATLLGAIVSLGCGGPSTSPTEIRLGQVFELRAGASATLQDGLKVTFAGVRSDSRCPMDALCVWAGDAVVTLRLSHAAGNPAERELHTAERSGSEASYLAYVIKLVALSPYPRSDRQIGPDDYVATLTVEAAKLS